jgi:aryl-alcohol dehydrogenase-like predicted oxidoreductase
MSASKALGNTGLSISPLVLGGNVFGWTLDARASCELLSAAFEAGITTLDTADMYSNWVDGHIGGESERIIGQWLAANPGVRDRLTLFTKVGAPMGEGGGLSRQWIVRAAEDSLRRLRTDYIDLYFSHYPDEQTPHEETLRAYESLIASGKVRAIGASNYSRAQLEAAQAVADNAGLPSYGVLQLEYNLYDRQDYETHLQAYVQAKGLGVVSYFSLASGFLSGKYRTLADIQHAARAEDLERYFNPRGQRILDALTQLAAQLEASPASIALAWLMARPGISAPIASATSLAQLRALQAAMALELDEAALQMLHQASVG